MPDQRKSSWNIADLLASVGRALPNPFSYPTSAQQNPQPPVYTGPRAIDIQSPKKIRELTGEE
jgi:hypothetical protein